MLAPGRFFNVANVLEEPSGKDVKDYREQIKDLAALAARKRDPARILELVEIEVNEANKFCERFGFASRFSMPEDKTMAALKERSRVETARKAKQTAARNKKLEEESAEKVAQWLNGEKVSIPYTVQKVYLRHKIDTLTMYGRGFMETSKGATVPLAEAEKAFRFVISKRETGWHKNGEKFGIGDFQLDSVNESGVVAGCHRVAWDEIERFAAAQGWITLPAAL